MKSNYKPLIVAVFLVLAGLVSQTYSFPGVGAKTVEIQGFSSNASPSSLLSLAHPQILIGVAEGAQLTNFAALTQNVAAVVTDNTDDSADQQILPIDYDAAIQDPGQPIGSAVNTLETVQYTVKKGDTLSGISAKFNVSMASILGANPGLTGKSLRVGAKINIPGLIEMSPAPTSSQAQAPQGPALPNLNSYFTLPAQGNNENVLKGDNSIEIENSCGTPVVAAADGVVVPDHNIINTTGGWNDGYGMFVLLQHPFGDQIFTRYAQLSQVSVSVGDYVKQGQEIGLMGQTGSASNCSLLFQVMNAQNPFYTSSLSR